MSSRFRIALTIPVVVLLVAVQIRAAQAPRPNIVYFLMDDLGYRDVGFTGGTEIGTPEIDRLAAAGVRLDQFYVQPLCSPTRAALMTGRYPMRHGLQVGVVRPWARHGLPLGERTLPEALREAGYTTAIVGKWHLGHFDSSYVPTRRGFDRQYGHYNGAIDYFTHLRDEGLDWHRDDRACRDEGYSTHLLASEAVRLIEAQPKGKPLFLYVAFNAVHSPHQVPESYKTPYASLPEPRRTYAGMLAAADEAVGKVAAAIGKKGIGRETLIIFSSDNGGPAPGRVTDNGTLRNGKGTLYEGGVRVCAFVKWEGMLKPGGSVGAALHAVDWYPTLLGLAGAPLSQKLPLDGRDIWPVLTGGKPTPHEDILLNTTPWSGAIVAGEWKLVLNGGFNDMEAAENPGKRRVGDELVELFHLSKDRSEKANLAAQRPDIVRQLRSRLESYGRQAVPPKTGPRPPDFVSPKVW